MDFLVVGDSLTAGSQSVVDGTRPGDGSWVDAADLAPARFVGGWAVPGATTAAMVAGAAGVRAYDEDVVVLAGTNDVGRGVAPAETLINVETIVATVGSDDVLLVAIPPLDLAPGVAADLNAGLSDLAATRGWGFTDPWLDVRDEGRWTAGASLDGVHPTQDVADVVGTRIRTWLLTNGG